MSFEKDLHSQIEKRVASGYKYQGYPVYPLTMSDVKKISSVANKYGFPPEWLANLINYESAGTFNPAIQNSIGATGLIQFLKSTASGSCLNTTTDDLKRLSFSEQMDYVDKYLKCNFESVGASRGVYDKTKGKVTKKMTQTDLFMFIFYPASVGNTQYAFPPAVINANSGTATPAEYAMKALRASTAPFRDIPGNIMSTAAAIKRNPGKAIAATIGLVGITLGIIFLIRRA